MNVIIANDFAHINGGASQVALTSAVGLADQGYKVIVFSAVLPILDRLRHPNIRTVVTEQHEIIADPEPARAAVQGIWNTKAKAMFGALLAECDPNNTVVHVHGWVKALSTSIIREAALRRFKVVCTLHDYFTACPNGGFFNFQTEQICHLRPLSIRCVATNCDIRSYLHKEWRVMRQIIQNTYGRMHTAIAAYIAVSDFSGQILRPYLSKGVPVFRVDNPVDVERDAPAHVDQDAPFVYVGHLSAHKGPALLARAACAAGETVLFIGDGEGRSAIAQHLPEARITGWLGKAQVHDEINEARALVLPSLWYETQGLVVAEAAALGVPAIVPDTSAARDMVIDGVTGMWFSGGSESSLAARLVEMRRPGVAEAMGRAAYDAYWRDAPTVSRHVDELGKCYRRILGLPA